MRRLVSGEEGAALLWVLVVMTVGLLIVGAVSALSSVNMRMARFETDHTLALYAAESGINHALALLGGSENADSQVVTNQLQNVELPGGGAYSVTMEGSGAHWTLTSVGEYHSREREIQIVRVPTGGSVFHNYVVHGDDVQRIDVSVPDPATTSQYNNAEVKACADLASLHNHSTEHKYYKVNSICTEADVSNISLLNVTVFVRGLSITGDSSMLLNNSNLHVREHAYFSGGPNLIFDGPNDNNFFIHGDLTLRSSTLSLKRLNVGQVDAWDYIQAGGHILIEGSTLSAGSPEPVKPHVVFTAACERDGLPHNAWYHPAWACIELRGSAFQLIGGVYAPKGTVRVDGDPSAEHGIGSIVGDEVMFRRSLNGAFCEDLDDLTESCPLRDSLRQNWTPEVNDRMQTVKFRGEGGASAIRWDVLR